MAEELIVSISGMRGIVGENLDAEIAEKYGAAFGTYLKRNHEREKLSVCIGKDSRPSGGMLKDAVAMGLCKAGIDVVDLGVVSTPSVGIMLRHLQCAGGIVITASHNPGQYNGIKLLLDNGIAPPKGVAEEIKKCYLEEDFDLASQAGQLTTNEETDDIHLDKVLAIIDKDSIAAKKFKIVLDSVNGAGGPIGQKLLRMLGCEIVGINIEPTGIFAHTPEPIEANLGGLCEAVREYKADIGFAQDPDADRLAIVAEDGSFIGEEYTLALAAKYIFSEQGGSAAANLSTSRMIDDIAKAAGGKVFRTPVGEANVADAMVKNNCVIGGEGNGGVIDLRVGPIRDSLVAMALILQLLAKSQKAVSRLADEVGGYFMKKDKFAADKNQAEQIINMAKDKFSNAKINTSDGCRFDFDDGWLHLRTSNTEPVMRIIVEADSQVVAEKYIEVVSDIRSKIIG